MSRAARLAARVRRSQANLFQPDPPVAYPPRKNLYMQANVGVARELGYELEPVLLAKLQCAVTEGLAVALDEINARLVPALRAAAGRRAGRGRR